MSLSELTRNAFQSGFPAVKWISLCKLFLSKRDIHLSTETQTDLSNSVLILFRNYPGDPALRSYLEHAIQEQIISLPTFVSTFLAAARSPDLHGTATLNTLCRVALNAHYGSGAPPIGSLVLYSQPTVDTLRTIQDAIALLQTAYNFSTAHVHTLLTSASELLILLVSCVTDLSQVSTAQAMMNFAEASNLLQNPRIAPAVRQVLETYALSLSLLLGDDARVAREAQMMHTLQIAMGKGSVTVSSSDTDLTTCGLVFHGLISGRADEYGSGDSAHAPVLLLGLYRWSSWTPANFLVQLLLSALTCLAQSYNHDSSNKSAMMWRSFVVGRLPVILYKFQQAAVQDGAPEAEWRTAPQVALMSVLRHTDLLEKCDVSSRPSTADSGNKVPSSQAFTSEFLHQLLRVGWIDSNFAITVSPTLANDFHPKVESEAHEAGVDLGVYFESRLTTDNSTEDAAALLDRALKEPGSHPALAETIRKRFMALAGSLDIEHLSHICKLLSSSTIALDIISLHTGIRDIVSCALIAVDDYDQETIGDPQTAVSHLGDIVLFLQHTIAHFNLPLTAVTINEPKARALSPDYLFSIATPLKILDLPSEDLAACNAWHKALFDHNSEGIEDTILRATHPKVLLRIAPTLFLHAITQCADKRLDREAFNNGVSYFLGPLLNWTLVGIIKTLLRECQRRAMHTPMHFEVLGTIIKSTTCPPVVLKLTALAILRLFPENKMLTSQVIGFTPIQYDPTGVRAVALRALGLPADDKKSPSSESAAPNTASVSWDDRPRQAIRDTLSAARAGRAPALDVNRCLILTTPTKFLRTLWHELIGAALGDAEVARRIATYVLTMPRAPRSPPLLPIFLHVVLPSLVAESDALPPAEQRIAIDSLVSIVSSALTSALHFELATHTILKEKRFALGQSTSIMARRLAGDLKRKGHGETGKVILEHLAASQAFAANFPTFMADLNT